MQSDPKPGDGYPLLDQARLVYGDDVAADPAMAATLEGAAVALARVLREVVDIYAPSPFPSRVTPERDFDAPRLSSGPSSVAPGGPRRPSGIPSLADLSVEALHQATGAGAAPPDVTSVASLPAGVRRRAIPSLADAGYRQPASPQSAPADSAVGTREVAEPTARSDRPRLASLTAAEAARAISARELSPVELVEALLARADEVDNDVQAWEMLDREGARRAARAAERQVLAGEPLGLAHGVPLGVKDIFDTAGVRTAAGFKPFDSRVPAQDAAVVASLRSAGAIMLGKTVATQFAFTDPSRTRNPWSAERTPGGSSSGSGAAVAAREIPWAIGSQTAGSTLRPAAYNGVIGFKPSGGLISTAGATPLAWSLDTVGIITRSVEDCVLFLSAATASPDAPAATDRRPSPGLDPMLVPPRLGLVRDWLDVAEPEMRAHVEGVAQQFEQAGAEVREVRLSVPNDLIQAVHRLTILSEIGAAYATLWETNAADLGPILRAGIQTGRLLPVHAYLHAQRLRRRIGEALVQGLEGLDGYLLPTATGVAPAMDTTGDPSLQVPATLVGLPAISLPSGLAGDGLPLAVQLSGHRGGDRQLLGAAAWCERVLGPAPSPPRAS
jgi:aspartyl-tRNA(Asn)/glutamyl-tRNA(Gln) amidotransferase subunit A